MIGINVGTGVSVSVGNGSGVVVSVTAGTVTAGVNDGSAGGVTLAVEGMAVWVDAGVLDGVSVGVVDTGKVGVIVGSGCGGWYIIRARAINNSHKSNSVSMMGRRCFMRVLYHVGQSVQVDQFLMNVFPGQCSFLN